MPKGKGREFIKALLEENSGKKKFKLSCSG